MLIGGGVRVGPPRSQRTATWSPTTLSNGCQRWPDAGLWSEIPRSHLGSGLSLLVTAEFSPSSPIARPSFTEKIQRVSPDKRAGERWFSYANRWLG